jgi:hypothetical protein
MPLKKEVTALGAITWVGKIITARLNSRLKLKLHSPFLYFPTSAHKHEFH